MEQDFRKIALEYNAGDRADNGLHYIHSLQTDWLLVLENADNPGIVNLEYYMPQSLHAHVLVTSISFKVSHLASSGCAFVLPAPDLLQSIADAFAHCQRIATLVAKGGTGKTQVALKLAAADPLR